MNKYHESHDRVFSTIADGSVVLTSTSDFYRKAFDTDEIILYDHKKTAGRDLPKLIFDDTRLREIAENGWRKLLSDHTWRRAETTMRNYQSLIIIRINSRLSVR